MPKRRFYLRQRGSVAKHVAIRGYVSPKVAADIYAPRAGDTVSAHDFPRSGRNSSRAPRIIDWQRCGNGVKLWQFGILYCPDYLLNADGVMGLSLNYTTLTSQRRVSTGSLAAPRRSALFSRSLIDVALRTIGLQTLWSRIGFTKRVYRQAARHSDVCASVKIHNWMTGCPFQVISASN
jgi:hypothetical protein